MAVGMAFSNGRGVDGVIITASTSSSDPVSQGARMCRKRGRIVLAIDGRNEDYLASKKRGQHRAHGSCGQGYGQYPGSPGPSMPDGTDCYHIVKNDLYGDQDERLLRREPAQRVGDDMEVELLCVDAWERTGTGKFRFVVSELPE